MVIETHRLHRVILAPGTVYIESIQKSIIVDGIASTTVI
jgi:hypothetical protein